MNYSEKVFSAQILKGIDGFNRKIIIDFEITVQNGQIKKITEIDRRKGIDTNKPEYFSLDVWRKRPIEDIKNKKDITELLEFQNVLDKVVKIWQENNDFETYENFLNCLTEQEKEELFGEFNRGKVFTATEYTEGCYPISYSLYVVKGKIIYMEWLIKRPQSHSSICNRNDEDFKRYFEDFVKSLIRSDLKYYKKFLKSLQQEELESLFEISYIPKCRY